MIVKSLSRRSGSTGQLVRYALKYVLEKEQKVQSLKEQKSRSFIIKHNVRSRSITGYIREFEALESLRQHKRSNSVSLYHYILSFSSKDTKHVTDAMLLSTAKRFIEIRGKDNLYVGSKHEDRQHIHLHIVMSAVDVAGRGARISKAQFLSLKQELDAWQKEQYPELINSLPEHGRKSKGMRQTVADTTGAHRGSEKGSLIQTLAASYASAKSPAEFFQSLSAQGYTPYERLGQVAGISTEGGRKYSLARLGYSEKLESLSKEAQVLAELQELRGHGARDRSQSQVLQTQPGNLSEQESKDLADIRSIREDSAGSREKEDIRDLTDNKEENEATEEISRHASEQNGRDR
jgi:hypothetical protein